MLLAIPKPLLSPEIADLRRDITRGYVTEILESQDEILRNQGGYGAEALTIYEALKNDDQVQACMNQLIDGANKLDYEVILGARKGRSPMRLDTKAMEFVQEVVDNLDFKNIIAETLWTKFYGYGVNELLPIRDGANTILDFSKGGIRVRNRRRFRYDFDLNVRLLTLENYYPGELMHDSRVWTTRYGADNSDEPYGLGDASGCYWWVIFKKGGVREWLRFLREFARPTTYFKHPPNISDPEKEEIDEANASLEAGKNFRLSNNVELGYLETNRTGTSDYKPMIDVCNSSIARVIIGATETTQSSESSGYAQAKVHEDVKDSTITAIDRIVFSSFNRQVIPKLVDWNYRGAMLPTLQRKEAVEDINKRVDREAKLFDLGIRLDPKSVTKIYGEDYLVTQQDSAVLLNGAQIASLNQLIKDAASGAIPIESARQLAIAALGIPEAIADKIIQPLLDKEKEAQEAAAKQAEEAANLFPEGGNNEDGAIAEQPAEFSEFYAFDDAIEFAAAIKPNVPVKKNCTTGVYCIGKTGKGSCVKAGSKCRSKAKGQSQQYAEAIKPEAGAATEMPATKVEPEASPKTAKASPTKFKNVDDRAAVEKLFQEWDGGIADVRALAKQETSQGNVVLAQKDLQLALDGKAPAVSIFDTKTLTYQKIDSQSDLVDHYRGKVEEAQKRLEADNKKVTRTPTVDANRIWAAHGIYAELKNAFAHDEGTMSSAALVGEDGKAKAVYMYRPDKKKKALYVEFLVSSPEAMFGDKSGKGAGSEAIKEVVRKSIKSGYGGKVSLTALDDAIPFYKKLGFQGKGDKLTLSPEKAMELING